MNRRDWATKRETVKFTTLCGSKVLGEFYRRVVIATTDYFSGVERIPEHIPVVIFSGVALLMFEKSSVFPRRRTSLNHRAMSQVNAGLET